MASTSPPDIYGIYLHADAIGQVCTFANRSKASAVKINSPLNNEVCRTNWNEFPFNNQNPTLELFKRELLSYDIANKDTHVAPAIFACLDALIRLSQTITVYDAKKLGFTARLDRMISHWEAITIDILSSLKDSTSASDLVEIGRNFVEHGIPSPWNAPQTVILKQEEHRKENTDNYWARILAAANNNRTLHLGSIDASKSYMAMKARGVPLPGLIHNINLSKDSDID